MEKIKILHVTENLITGGAEKFLLDLAANHDAERFQVAVLNVHPRTGEFIFEDLLGRLKIKNNVQVYYLDKQYKGFGLIAMQHKIIKIIREFRPDIVHSHLNGIMYVILPAILKRIPIRLQTVHLDALHEAFVIGGKVQEASKTLYKMLKILPAKTAKKIREIQTSLNDNNQEQYREYKLIGFLEKSRVYKKVSASDFFEKAAVGGRLLKFAYKRSGFIPVAISDSVKKSLQTIYGLNDMPMIYNGIDIEAFKMNKINNDIERNDAPDRDSIKIIHIGRFDPAKNHELLIDAIAIVLKNVRNLKVQLVGEGEYRARLMKKAIKSNLGNHVDFLGVRKDTRELLADSDIFVLSSIAEGFGLVLVEAMALGLPIVSTDVGAVKEVVRDGVNGILVEPNSPRALANAMETLIKDKEKRKQMGQAGIEIASGFDIHITTRKYNRLYEQLYEHLYNPDH